jgi:cytochrome c-type biogenesis protein CcmH/NrfG
MIVLLIVGGLTFAVGLLVLRPFGSVRGDRHIRVKTSDDGRRRELLRQLRDLDDDRAAGKLSEADHVRLRAPVEREAAAVLGRARSKGVSKAPPPVARTAARRWRRRTVASLALAAGLASVTILLVGATSPRSGGLAISGDPVPGAAAGSPSDGASATDAWQQSATPEQLTAIDAAAARVQQNPKDATGHLALADAYAAAGASQLAAVEYLAVTQLDPANAEANTYLALLAFEAGQAVQGKTMVDRVLAAHPDYPEALYVRGLILLTGLHQPQAAERDLNAYLAVAPTGSYRTAVETLLVLAKSQERR